jgi:2-succinyl-6-hydroxy-2,4-cyclohexadiene-1-carboxylate synthase
MTTAQGLHTRRLAAGEAGRAPVVLVHGFTGDTTTWERFAEAWLAAGGAHSLLAVDLPGHGLSPRLRQYSLPDAAERLVAALPARCHLLGYSMGGRVALQAALTAPAGLLTLTLIGASPGLPDPEARRARAAADEALARRLLTEPFEAWVDAWMAQPLFATQAGLPADLRAAARVQRLANDPADLAAALVGMGTGAMAPLHERLGALRVPALLVAGELDPKFTALAREMARRIPDATVAVVPGVGHAVQMEAPERLAALLRSWLAAR